MFITLQGRENFPIVQAIILSLKAGVLGVDVMVKKTGCGANPVMLIRTIKEESKMVSPAGMRTHELRVRL